jgi:hypothetical protein
MTQHNRKRKHAIATMHIIGCIVSLLVMLALPTLRFHHCHTAIGSQEMEREAARESFVTTADSSTLNQIARSVQHTCYAGALNPPANERSLSDLRAAAVHPLARLIRRLKLPPPSSDPFSAILV